ncbi:MAG: DASS family sodium-coupled anion symporter [Pseudomonadota bacterium]
MSVEISKAKLSAGHDQVTSPARTLEQWLGLGFGLFIFLGMMLAPVPDGLAPSAWVTAALALLMISWWVTEAVPIPVTSLLPLIILPLFGVMPLREASAAFMSPINVLLISGFIIAKGIERWNLHERIALMVVDSVGVKPPALIAGFMLASALLSMWISNTATALMMMPIAISVARAILGDGAQSARFTVVLVLGVAYACSIGGLGTPVGSPTNLIVIGYLAELGLTVTFADWMRLGIPVVLLLLPCAWLVLWFYGARAKTLAREMPDVRGESVDAVIHAARLSLGRATVPELRTLMVFILIALSWIFRAQLQTIPGLALLNDQIIGVLGVVLLFIIPSGSKEERGTALLDWRTAERIPWGVFLLFGGGLSLASAITSSGLATYLAGAFQGIDALSEVTIIATLTLLVLGLTEFTSNVATVSALMPIVGAIAAASGINALFLAAPVGLAASCAFMLPIATGPNAVAFATGNITMARMAMIGIRVNLLGALAIILVVSLLAPAS